MVLEVTYTYLSVMLLLHGYIQARCPGQGEPFCSSCVNHTAVCRGRCIGNSSYSRGYGTLICIGHGSRIWHLDLSFNSLNQLDCTSTPGIKLKTLLISNNKISFNKCRHWDTTVHDCYITFRHIEFIDISFNRIKNSCNTLVFSLRKLQHVNLSHNQVSSLDNLPFFSSANNIRVVDLSHNRISYLPSDLFQSKPYLVSLNISYNNFQQFWIHYNLLLEPSRTFDLRIYRNNVLHHNGILFSNGTQRQVSHIRRCVVSISRHIAYSSSCDTDAHYLSDEHRLLHQSNYSKSKDQPELYNSIYVCYTPCHLLNAKFAGKCI